MQLNSNTLSYYPWAGGSGGGVGDMFDRPHLSNRDTFKQNVDGQNTPVLKQCGATYFCEKSKNMYASDSYRTDFCIQKEVQKLF